MSKFKKTAKKAETMDEFTAGASIRTTQAMQTEEEGSEKRSFLLKLESHQHALLKKIAKAEERSMQWVLRKLTHQALEQKAKEINIVER